MIIEGKNAVEAALTGDATVEKIMIQRDVNNPQLVKAIKESRFMYQFVDRAAMDRISKSKNHQGFIAFVTDFKYHHLDRVVADAQKKGTQPLLLVLDGVEDPHNLGNIIRTAECMGVDGIIIPKNRAVAVTDTVIRVSAGAASHIKICRVTNINTEIEYLKSKGFWVYAVEVGGVNIAQTNLTGPVALVLGGENTGVRQLTMKLCDGVVSIKLRGRTNSLNVATAAAMSLFEVVRQRDAK
jgi:23S rRNA (guanosine2251-2'-O)-methyltransferase